MNAYTHLPLTQRRTQQIVDQFNAAEEYGAVWKPSDCVGVSFIRTCRRELQKQFDLLDFANAQLPQHCIGFVVEP